MAFRIEYSTEAEADLNSILEWLISQHAGQPALRWFEGLVEAVASLSEMPQRCPLAPENKRFPFEVRHLLYGRKPHIYRIIFTVESDKVVILHVWHGRRRPLENPTDLTLQCRKTRRIREPTACAPARRFSDEANLPAP